MRRSRSEVLLSPLPSTIIWPSSGRSFRAVRPSEVESLSSHPSREMRSRRSSPRPTFSSARPSPKGARRSTRSCTRRARRVCRCSRAMWPSTSSLPTCLSGSASPGVTPPTLPGPCSRSQPQARRCGQRLEKRLPTTRPQRSFGGVVGGCGAPGTRGRSQREPVPPEYDLSVPSNVAPPARRSETPPDPPRGEPRDIRSSRPRPLTRSSLGWGVRRLLSVAALVALDIVGLALGLMVALVVRTLLYGSTVFWSLLWSHRSGRVAAVPGAGHRARLLPGRPVRGARAPLGSGAHRLVPGARRTDRAGVRPRHRLRLHDDGPHPDGRRHLRSLDRSPAGRL